MRVTTCIFAYYLVLGVFTFALVGYDKMAAASGFRRVPEQSLHAMALLGGWCGAWLGYRSFRHKTKKARFQLGFRCCVACNLAAAALFLGMVVQLHW